MSKVRVRLISKGVRSLLQSQEMMNICTHLAYQAQSRLGDGYEVTYMTGKTRVNASIGAKTAKAIKENYENNTILKALGGK